MKRIIFSYAIALFTVLAVFSESPIGMSPGQIDEFNRYRQQYPRLTWQIYEAAIAANAETGLRISYIFAIISAESEFKPGAVSPVGAIGLMQIMPKVWHKNGDPNDLRKPYFNIMRGSKILSDYLASAGGDLMLALKFYERGPGGKGYNLPYARKIIRNIGVSDPGLTVGELMACL